MPDFDDFVAVLPGNEEQNPNLLFQHLLWMVSLLRHMLDLVATVGGLWPAGAVLQSFEMT